MPYRIVSGRLVEISDAEEAAFRATIPPPTEATYATATKLGLKRALTTIGRWADVKALIKSSPDIEEDWLLCTEVSITDTMFQAAIAMGGFTQAEVEEVFRLANQPESPSNASEEIPMAPARARP